ncbi:MAG TPA: ABC transporter substrate-binding protein [Anaerolineae bacterium]|nr:ABC transporter substrate-binding protein [Anaerolineae bacterium]
MILTLVLGVAACTAATPAPAPEAPAEPAEAAVPTEEAAEPAEAAAPTEEAAEAAAPTEEAAEEEAAEAASGESIKIGAMYNVTGGMSSIDAPGLNGMKLAAEEINAAGGVLGRSLEVIAIDGKTDQTTVTNAVSEMIEVNGVVAIGGLNDSTFALAAGPIAQEAGVPFVTAGATLPTLPEQVGDYFFMVPFGDDTQAYAIADYAVDELEGKTAYMLVDQAYDFTTALASFFKERWEARGGEIVLEDIYQSGDTDFSAQIARVKELDPQPDVLFISAVPNEAGITTLQFREAGLNQPILSGDGFDTPLIGEVAGDLATDVYYSTHASLDNPDPKVANFVSAYEAAYGNPPENAFAALGYDMMNLIADAIERAGADDPAAIRDALAGTQDFQAVTGTITYPEGQRKPAKSVTIIQVQNGAYSFAAEITPE